MVTLLLCVLIGVIIGVAVGSDGEERFLGGFFGLMMGMIVGALIAFVLGVTLPSEYVLVNETELVALRDNGTVKGSFFLGCGSIKSEFYYFFYKKDGDGKIRFGKLLADNRISIIEEDGEGGVLQKYRLEPLNGRYNFWGLVGQRSSYRYEIHIPVGSIVNNFKLDLE